MTSLDGGEEEEQSKIGWKIAIFNPIVDLSKLTFNKKKWTKLKYNTLGVVP